MKKVIFILVLYLSSLVAFAQTESDAKEKRMKYGFNLGINYANLLDDNALPSNATLTNNVGFQLGILADYTMANFFSISPKVELSFNNCEVNFTNTDGSQTVYEVMPISLDLMAHFVFKKTNSKVSPYFYFGPDFKIPLSNKSTSPTSFSTGYDFAIDLGIGIDKTFKNFNFAPELRYSFGLMNVNQNPSIQTLNFHSISLIFNFLG
jgi:hypothetical protein